MTHAQIAEVEVAMNQQDGTYRLQYVRVSGDEAWRLQHTVVAETIPDGLRALAEEMEQQGRKEFFAR